MGVGIRFFDDRFQNRREVVIDKLGVAPIPINSAVIELVGAIWGKHEGRVGYHDMDEDIILSRNFGDILQTAERNLVRLVIVLPQLPYPAAGLIKTGDQLRSTTKCKNEVSIIYLKFAEATDQIQICQGHLGCVKAGHPPWRSKWPLARFFRRRWFYSLKDLASG